jgi:limonene-1,2-epoxide hydrolase
MLAPILTWSDRVEWEVVEMHAGINVTMVERIDRFWIDGDEYAVRCNGVFGVDTGAGVVTSVRDYVDLEEWRDRITPIYERMASRSSIEVVRRHLAAVDRREVASMAADYALDAQLLRGTAAFTGWFAIAEYFDTVGARLGPHTLRFTALTDPSLETATVEWIITGDSSVVATGTDHYRVVGGRIVEQVVVLDGTDF